MKVQWQVKLNTMQFVHNNEKVRREHLDKMIDQLGCPISPED